MRVLFMGTPEYALPSLEVVAERHQLVAVVTQPDRPRGRGRRQTAPPAKRWAVERGVPVEQPETLRSSRVLRTLEEYRPDAVSVAAYGLILPPAVLAIPPRGCINVHASLLPRHRGAAPVARSILAGDRRTGVTTMLMDEGLDTGPILLQEEIEVGARETRPELTERLARLGGDLLGETLDRWAREEIEPRRQDDEAATAAPRLTKEEGEIDWSEPADRIDRRVRALMPWPGTWTYLDGDRFRVWWVEPHGVEAGDPEASPGTVLRADEQGIWVACGDGGVAQVTEVQRAGSRRMPAADYLRGRPLEPGRRLGS